MRPPRQRDCVTGSNHSIAAMRHSRVILNEVATFLVKKSCHRLTTNVAVSYGLAMSRKSKPPVILYSALADATRCRILEILRAAPTPVHVLTEAFLISRPAISRHLRVLKSAGLVAEVKKGRENVYAFRPARLAAAETWLQGITAVAEKEPPAEPALPPPAKPSRPRKARPAALTAEREDQAPVRSPAPAAASQMGFDF
ncbi:hypothetical protein DMC47_00500 [Nostoc sp. 3335mG]|nr:hypothetical protein DMC47_00500 [Nostoc sp. 3335mG]